KGNQKAGFSTDAFILAQDMADRIQAYNDIDVTTDDDAYKEIDTSEDASDPGCISSTGCSATDQVDYDAWDWGRQISSKLPGGIGVVDYDAGVYTVTVMWDGNQDGSTGTECNGAAEQLLCYSLEFKL